MLPVRESLKPCCLLKSGREEERRPPNHIVPSSLPGIGCHFFFFFFWLFNGPYIQCDYCCSSQKAESSETGHHEFIHIAVASAPVNLPCSLPYSCTPHNILSNVYVRKWDVSRRFGKISHKFEQSLDQYFFLYPDQGKV